MYIYKSFGVYFHLSSDTGPNMCFLLFFFFWHEDFYLSFFFLLLNYYGGSCENSKLIEKIQNLLPCILIH